MHNKVLKKILLLLTATAIAFFATSYLLSNATINNQLLEAAPYADATLFDFNTELSKNQYTVNQYILSYSDVDSGKVDMLSGLFGLRKTKGDSLYSYYENDFENLAVSLDGRVLNYERLSTPEISDERLISANDAKESAISFINDKSLPLDYGTVEVTYEDGKFLVRFINTINGIKNYSYTKSAVVDRNGNILQMTYYDLSYQVIGTIETISAIDASKKLREKNFDIPSTVDIKSCELVYYETNQRLSPSYKFTGEIDGGISVVFFVPAEKK